MRCLVCDSEIPRRLETLREKLLSAVDSEDLCGDECSSIWRSLQKRPESVQIHEFTTQHEFTKSEEMGRWGKASRRFLENPTLLLLTNSNGKICVHSRVRLSAGTHLQSNLSRFIEKRSIGNVVSLHGELIVTKDIEPHQGLVEGGHWIAHSSDATGRFFTCPVKPYCDGVCKYDTNWMCSECGSWWKATEWEAQEIQEQRAVLACCEARERVEVNFESGMTRRALNANMYKSLSQAYETLVNSTALHSLHWLFAELARLFSVYFHNLTTSMRSRSVQETTSLMCLRWTKLFLKRAVDSGLAKEYPIRVSETLMRCLFLCHSFPAHLSESIWLARFFLSITEGMRLFRSESERIESMFGPSRLRTSSSACWKWLQDDSIGFDDVVEYWSQYLADETTRALKGSENPMVATSVLEGLGVRR